MDEVRDAKLNKVMGCLAEIVRTGTPKEFYPYTSVVLQRDDEYSLDHYDEMPQGTYSLLLNMLCAVFRNAPGVKKVCKYGPDGCHIEPDNKVVFGYERYGVMVYVGFYDGHLSIGKAVGGDHVKRES